MAYRANGKPVAQPGAGKEQDGGTDAAEQRGTPYTSGYTSRGGGASGSSRWPICGGNGSMADCGGAAG